jgi:hypothetical protein
MIFIKLRRKEASNMRGALPPLPDHCYEQALRENVIAYHGWRLRAIVRQLG